MDYPHSITDAEKRKKGKHLTDIDRGTIQALNREGMSLRKIAGHIGCSPSTILNELRRGTPPRKSNRVRAPGYSAKHGAAVYRANRKRSKRPHKVCNCAKFLGWTHRQVKEENWSLDVCWGHALKSGPFQREEMVCTKTLYNYVDLGMISLKNIDLPEKVSRNTKKRKVRENKKKLGDSIDLREECVESRKNFGNWEIDSVLGKKTTGEPCVITLTERKLRVSIWLKLPNHSADAMMEAMEKLKAEYGEHFSKVFQTITADNGSEFTRLSELEEDGAGVKVYFAHPYSSWERGTNECHNRMLRRFILKGKSIADYSEEDIQFFADRINALPRKILGYQTPEELFEQELDRICQRASLIKLLQLAIAILVQ